MAVNRTVLPRKGLVQPQHGLTGYEADQDGNWSLLDSSVAFMSDLIEQQNQSANLVLAGPASGGAVKPTFRSLVAADLPGNLPANIATSGQGGFFGVSIFNPGSAAALMAVLASANKVLVQQFVLPFTAKVSKIVFEITTPSSGGKCDVGIYSAVGNLLLNTGGVSTTSAAIQSVTLGSPVTLAPGVYYLAWTGDNTTFVLRALATSQSYEAYQRQNTARNGTASTAANAGVLPSNFGTITGAALNAAAVWFEP